VINIGIIGCGYWGPNLVRNFNACDNVKVVGVADLREERLKFLSRLYPNIKTYTKDSNELLHNKNIDAIVIATPVSTHFPLGMEALENGKHLLMEKPMTATSEQSEVLIEAAEKKGLTLMVDRTISIRSGLIWDCSSMM
jgi:predicted dehydrogenase